MTRAIRSGNAGIEMLSARQKRMLIDELVASLAEEREVCRIVIFGSFLHSDAPHDLDVAVFQDSKEAYLPLALKYRKKTRRLARTIPLDIVPLKAGVQDGSFLDEIERGKVIYER
jgi:predicted nucleotidyltransferase